MSDNTNEAAVTIAEVKQLIVNALSLEDISPVDIDSDAPLFSGPSGTGLGLDSIDALELGLALQRKYGVQLSTDPAANREHFSSVQAICNLINSQPRPASAS